VIAEGADAVGMSRSIPLAKIMDDALLKGAGCGFLLSLWPALAF
jgi:hypothetical protein